MRRTLRVFKRLGLLLLVLLVVFATGGYVYLRQSLPQLAGVLAAPGLSAPVEIVRDDAMVTHLYADNLQDAVYGLGYAHAQDRLWQMELQRRFAQGRLSELLGEALFSTDRFFRTLGAYRAAQADWTTLDGESRVVVEAYIAGVNAFIARTPRYRLPPEFTLLQTTLEPWSGPDVLVTIKMLSFDVDGNFGQELLRAALIGRVGAERARALMPLDSQAARVSAAQLEVSPQSLGALADQIGLARGVAGLDPGGIGSNSWVVGSASSETQAPVLANDPHLGFGLPSLWYMAHLSAGDLQVIGATVPGLPLVLIGRNQQIAWGLTSLSPDVQDLYRERLDPAGQMAEFQGRWEPLRVITETISVRGQNPTQLTIRATRHGPLISDAINADAAALPLEQRPTPLEPLALRWTATLPNDTTVAAFLGVNRARDWATFTAALRQFVAPAQNVIYADVQGNIGYYAAGSIPVRAGADQSLPLEGWSGQDEWRGWVPFEELPQSFNPAAQYLVTANNRPVPDDYPHLLASDWEPPYRAERITTLLTGKPRLSLADHMQIQGDTVSPKARALLPLLLPLVQPQSDQERAALELLQNWNASMQGEQAAAALFQSWYLRLLPALVDDELGPDLGSNYRSSFSATQTFLPQTLGTPSSPWCDDTTTAEAESCAGIAMQTFRAALAELGARHGNDPAGWRWDDLHVAVFAHQPFDEVALLRPIFSRSLPGAGDESSVNVAPLSGNGSFEQRAGAGLRLIFDLADPDGGYFIVAGGQSGHVLSPHYDDYLNDWRALRYRALRFTRPSVESVTVARLRLEPAPATSTGQP